MKKESQSFSFSHWKPKQRSGHNQAFPPTLPLCSILTLSILHQHGLESSAITEINFWRGSILLSCVTCCYRTEGGWLWYLAGMFFSLSPASGQHKSPHLPLHQCQSSLQQVQEPPCKYNAIRVHQSVSPANQRGRRLRLHQRQFYWRL